MAAKAKIPDILAKWLFVLCVPLLLVAAGIGWVANSRSLYLNGFQKYGVSQTTGLNSTELEKAAHGLIGYFNSSEEYINVTVIKDAQPFQLFNQREIAHLKDVKGLIRLDYWILLGTLVYVLGYAAVYLFWRKDQRKLARGMIAGSGLTLVLMLALGLGTLFGFDKLFLQFHLISFSNDLWLLDPTRDYLIMLFPEGFFADAALLATGIATGVALVLGGVAGVYLLSTRSKASN